MFKRLKIPLLSILTITIHKYDMWDELGFIKKKLFYPPPPNEHRVKFNSAMVLKRSTLGTLLSVILFPIYYLPARNLSLSRHVKTERRKGRLCQGEVIVYIYNGGLNF